MDAPGTDRPEDVNAIEYIFGRLKPAPVALDRDRLLFEAGRAAGRAESRQSGLRIACAALAFVTLGLSGLAWRQHQALQVRADLVSRSLLSPPAEGLVERPDPSSYMALRHSLDAPLPIANPASPIPPGEPGTLTVRDTARVLDF